MNKIKIDNVLFKENDKWTIESNMSINDLKNLYLNKIVTHNDESLIVDSITFIPVEYSNKYIIELKQSEKEINNFLNL